MKIWLTGPAFPLRGGIAMFNELLAKSLQEAGHECEIVSFSLQYPDFLFPGTTQYDTTGKAPQGLVIRPMINSINPLSWFRTARAIARQQPDVVIIRFWIPFMGMALGTIARSLRRKGIKVIAITDNVIPHEKRPGDALLTGYFIRACQGFVAMSHAVIQDLDRFTRNRNKKMLPHPIYNSFGAAVSSEEGRNKLAIPQGDRIILFFGLIRDYKGLDLLLEALADDRLRQLNVRLLVAGEFYGDRKPYDQQIERLKLADRVLLHGDFIPTEEVKYYFAAANLVTQTYRTATQSGITQVAFHFEKPVVVTNVGGLAEIIPHGVAGYVVEPDAKAIADGICRFFVEEKEAEFTKGMQAEKAKYEWSRFVKGLEEVIQQAQ